MHIQQIEVTDENMEIYMYIILFYMYNNILYSYIIIIIYIILYIPVHIMLYAEIVWTNFLLLLGKCSV